jgi:hypothetical protein
VSVDVGEALTRIEGAGACSIAAQTETDLAENLQRATDRKLPTGGRDSIAELTLEHIAVSRTHATLPAAATARAVGLCHR